MCPPGWARPRGSVATVGQALTLLAPPPICLPPGTADCHCRVGRQTHIVNIRIDDRDDRMEPPQVDAMFTGDSNGLGDPGFAALRAVLERICAVTNERIFHGVPAEHLRTGEVDHAI